jgi:hypothetical protein
MSHAKPTSRVRERPGAGLCGNRANRLERFSAGSPRPPAKLGTSNDGAPVFRSPENEQSPRAGNSLGLRRRLRRQPPRIMKHIEARSARRPKLEAPGVVLDRGIRVGPRGSFPGIATSSSAMLFCPPRLRCFTLTDKNDENEVRDVACKAHFPGEGTAWRRALRQSSESP